MTTASTLPAAATVLSLDGDALYETVNGERVELPPMGAFESWIANRLKDYLSAFVSPRKLGQVVHEMLFRLSSVGGLERRPDVAFVSSSRWPFDRPAPRLKAWNVVPNMAVEVVSPTNTAEEVHTKIHDYFQAGVQQVWVVFPVDGEVYVYSSPTEVRILQRTDTLDGDPLLPGLKLNLADWLAAPAAN